MWERPIAPSAESAPLFCSSESGTTLWIASVMHAESAPPAPLNQTPLLRRIGTPWFRRIGTPYIEPIVLPIGFPIAQPIARPAPRVDNIGATPARLASLGPINPPIQQRASPDACAQAALSKSRYPKPKRFSEIRAPSRGHEPNLAILPHTLRYAPRSPENLHRGEPVMSPVLRARLLRFVRFSQTTFSTEHPAACAMG